MDWEEACNILGVQQTASLEEIDAQYHIKAFLLHPDHIRGYPEAVRKKDIEELILVQKAYEFLKVPSNNPISNPPKLKIEPMRIRFKDVEIGQRKTTTFQINNVGGIYTNIWIDNQPAPWLSVIAAKSTGAEQLPLEVTIECNGVGEEGKYDLYVMNSDGTNIVNVTPDYFPPDFLCHTPVFSMDDSRIYFIGEWWE